MMSATTNWTWAAIIGLSPWLTGCAPQSTAPAPTPAPQSEEHGHSHSHTGDDALVWGRSDIQHAGFTIQLGHHSRQLHAGTSIEPAVSITKDGQPTPDAQVFNSLLAAEGGAVLAAEVPTVYEPPTDDEPAHYAQGELSVPAGTTSGAIHYRIVLPGVADEVSYDLPVKFE